MSFQFRQSASGSKNSGFGRSHAGKGSPFGAFLVGSVVEAFGPRAGFFITGAGGTLAVAAVTLGWRWRRRPR